MTVDDLAELIFELQYEGRGSSELLIPSQTGGNKYLDGDDLIVEDAEDE